MLVLILFSSCGLDTFYVLKAPVDYEVRPLLSNEDGSQNYVEFYTREADQDLPADFNFKGTLVYYKIYGNKTTVESDILKIDSYNNDSSYGKAYSEMTGKGYQELRIAGNDSSYIINDTSVNKKVTIRLTDFNTYQEIGGVSDPIYEPYLKINDVFQGVPRRVVDDLSFNFGREGKEDFSKVPNSDNIDFDKTNPSDGIYYVNMYAVAYGFDVSTIKYYSNLLYLGTIKVNANSLNNW